MIEYSIIQYTSKPRLFKLSLAILHNYTHDYDVQSMCVCVCVLRFRFYRYNHGNNPIPARIKFQKVPYNTYNILIQNSMVSVEILS